MNRREQNRLREQQQAAEAAARAAQQTAAPAPSNVVPLHASPEPVARVQEAEVLPPVTRPAAPVLVVPPGKAEPATGDFVTILQCLGSLILVKTWLANGKIRSAGVVTILPDGTEQVTPPKRYFMLERRLSGPDDFFDLLDKLANERQVAIIRGKWAGETLPAKGEKIYKNKDTFEDHPHYWMALDVDKFRPKTADPVLEPEEAVEEYIQAKLPPEFHYRSYRWNLTASAGHPDSKGVLKARLVFWLKTPYGSGALKAWKIAKGIEVDDSLFNPTQLHYTGAPLFEDGVVDPVPVRYGRVKGFEDEVDLVIAESLLAQVKVRDRTGGGIDMSDPGERKWFGAAFCRAYDIDRCLEEFGDILPFEFESPGDDRRMNFIDGEHAPGGVFVTPCRNYMISVHGSSPFGSKPTNAFDLVRHYKFGDLDDDDGFDDDHARSTSSLRMQEWMKTLPAVQGELAAEREEQAAEREAQAAERIEAELEFASDDGESILAQLRAMTPEVLRARWVELALDASPIAEDRIMTHVAAILQVGRRPLQQTLKQARDTRDNAVRRAERQARIDKMSRGREILDYEPENRVAQARKLERLIVDRHERENTREEFFEFGGMVSAVRLEPLPGAHNIVEDEPPPPVPVIAALKQNHILEEVESVAVLLRITDRGPERTEVPDRILSVLMDLNQREAPLVIGLVTHPVVLHGGEILSTPGIHRCGLVLSGAQATDCRPYSQGEAAAALTRIRETLFGEFEFKSESDRDYAVAALLTGVQRKLLDKAPGFAFLASSTGTGKTTLAQVIHVILTGCDMPTFKFPEQNPDEQQKQLFTTLLRSPTLVCFDNITAGITLRSSVLAQVMTAPQMTGRVLGFSRDATVSTASLFIVTANNLALGSDESSRFVPVWLTTTSMSRHRRQFRNRDPVSYARRIRSDILRDCAGIVAGYITSIEAEPKQSRFPMWDRMVGEPLVWAGGARVSDAFDVNELASEEVSSRHVVLDTLRKVFEDKVFSARNVVEAADQFHTGLDDEARCVLVDALEGLHARDVKSPKSVGRVLRALDGVRHQTDDGVLMLTSHVAVGYSAKFKVVRLAG